MVVVRKSPFANTGNWFQRNSTPSPRKRRSTRIKSTLVRTHELENQPLPTSAQKQRRTPKKSSISANNPLPDISKQLNTTTPRNHQSNFLGVPVMPNSGALPLWLLRLYTSHRYSSVVTFLLVTATLCVYGWTVYSQQLWSQGYKKLQNLQLQERQLTTTNATLKNKMAEEAEKETSGLVSPTPAKTIFLPTGSPSQSSGKTLLSTPGNAETHKPTPSPLGY
ncbi:hypothetical protein NWP17_07080 [Chrysosporum bergii ANA360D]|uniref:Cell division protein FtsL n=1 Tax=Chrysosporum bergii ANA360D TaxID=617107 RepID=A0AA43GRU9_9CYAN|nr:hypothetical protein [Chrysosporum bergii]MDH6060201.1 hypothetical protein [Chrysosporum bergii ANA360D]